MLSVRSSVGFVFVPIEAQLATSLAVAVTQDSLDQDFLLEDDGKCLTSDARIWSAPPSCGRVLFFHQRRLRYDLRHGRRPDMGKMGGNMLILCFIVEKYEEC